MVFRMPFIVTGSCCEFNCFELGSSVRSTIWRMMMKCFSTHSAVQSTSIGVVKGDRGTGGLLISCCGNACPRSKSACICLLIPITLMPFRVCRPRPLLLSDIFLVSTFNWPAVRHPSTVRLDGLTPEHDNARAELQQER